MTLKRLIGDRDFYRRLFTVMAPVLVQNVITNFVSLLDNVMVCSGVDAATIRAIIQAI